MKRTLVTAAFLVTVAAGWVLGQGAPFREFPIGDEQRKHDMKIAAVWLPPVTMEGMEVGDQPDLIHLECDIHAIKGNKNGFGVGEWIPYLTVNYTLAHKESGHKLEGKMMPMVAKDGPHYGASLQMPARGSWSVTYELRPPSENGFGRHSDPVTGVDPWWEPFTVGWEFDYQGVK